MKRNILLITKILQFSPNPEDRWDNYGRIKYKLRNGSSNKIRVKLSYENELIFSCFVDIFNVIMHPKTIKLELNYHHQMYIAIFMAKFS